MTSSSSSSSDFNFDFNKDGAQKTFDVIPESTICTVQMTVRPVSRAPRMATVSI
jgi:hypothetical protein